MDDASPDISNLSLADKIAILESTLPVPVQEFLHSPERDATSLRLSQKYALHADQAMVFEQAYLYMLLGINSPDDFVQDLNEAGMSTDVVRGLTSDINEQVFKKLQQAELAPPPAPPVPVMHVAPPPPVAPVPVSAPTPPAPQPAYNLVPTQTHPSLVQTPAKPPILHTMSADMELAQHPMSAPVPATTPAPSELRSTMPSIPHESQVTPARSFQTASVPYTSMPAVSRPAQDSIAPAPSSYGADPYREPMN